MTAKSKTFQPPYSEEFELFWRSYPPRFNETRSVWIRADKPGAWLEWQKLTDEQKIAVLKLVQREKASKWTPDARKWLHHRPWEDDVAPSRREFQRPLIKEIQIMINKMLPPEKMLNPAAGIDIPLSDYELNKRRNENLDKLEANR